MTDDNSTVPQPAEAPPRWQPIGAIDRRVLGVLAEKAKTTPSGYPMSLNAIRTACNQKSNRAPVMNLEAEDVEESLERLRNLGAVGMIEGYGRVAKYRHYLYEWLGVEKVELAVMTELLLRGAQTGGELRARASRMEPISDLAALRPVLASLKSKGLVLPLTPEGRGHVVTHALYQPRELENVKAQFGQVPAASLSAPGGQLERGLLAGGLPPQAPIPQPTPAGIEPTVVEAMRGDIDELRSQLGQLRSDLEELADRQQQTDEELRELREVLGT
jgi:uncharacterized protein YceH (UPF0502 family)